MLDINLNLQECPTAGTVAWIDDSTKVIVMASSNRLIETIGRMVQNSKDGTSICLDNYKLVLLTDSRNKHIQKYIRGMTTLDYKLRGYKVINGVNIPKYKVITTIRDGKVVVKLVNSVYKIIYQQYFNSLEQAKLFRSCNTIEDMLKLIK